MTAEFLSTLAGVLLSLAFSYLPGVSDWFEKLAANSKRLLMLALLLLASLGLMGLACTHWGAALKLPLTCSEAGAVGLLKAFLAALVANQAAYRISPQKTAGSPISQGDLA